jgi:hypothetical protein
VLAVDVFLTGEYHTHAGLAGRDHGIPFFTTYNRTDAALRAHDVVTGLAYLAERVSRTSVAVIGVGEAGLWCLLGRALAPMPVPAVVDVAGFSGDDASYMERLYIPGLRAAGGLLTALALAAPAPTFIHNAHGSFPIPEFASLYDTLSCADGLLRQDGEATAEAIAAWLLRVTG